MLADATDIGNGVDWKYGQDDESCKPSGWTPLSVGDDFHRKFGDSLGEVLPIFWKEMMVFQVKDHDES